MAVNPTVSQGRRARHTFVTFSHGPARASLIDAMDFDPAVPGVKVMEISNPRGVGHIYNKVEGGGGKIESTLKNEIFLAAALQDRDPVAAGVLVDQKRFRSFCILREHLADDEERVIASDFALECIAQGRPHPLKASEAMKLSVPFLAKEIFELEGYGLRYERASLNTDALATPSNPVLAITAAAGTPFLAGEVVYVRVALNNGVHAPGDAAPTATAPLTQASGESAIEINANADKVVATITDPGAGKSAAIYVGKASGQCVFYDWVAAGSTTIDITAYRDLTNPQPLQQNQSGTYPHGDDKVFDSNVNAGITYPNSIVLTDGPKPKDLEGLGLPYIAVLKNGIAVPVSIDRTSEFGFSPDRKIFFLNAAPGAADVWEIVTPYDPEAPGF